MKRVAIFGGSFNPIHNGHLQIARAAIREQVCDEVWMMPSPQNPLKPSAGLLDERLRLEMVKAVLDNEEKIKVSDFEFQLPLPTYTYRTLKALRKDYPNYEFSLIIGGDNWKIFNKWRNYKEILQSTTIIIYSRPGADILPDELPEGAILLKGELSSVSSSEIRRRVSLGMDVSADVPAQVLEMVKKFYSK